MSLFKTILGLNLAESFVDNVFRDKVTPKRGSVVYCDLAFGYAEHSGIYIGNGEIVQLNKYGEIEAVSAREFIDGTSAITIYVSSRNGVAVGSDRVADRARSMIGKRRDYNVIMDNCHQFSSGCLSGNFENSDNFLWMLKDSAKDHLDANEWRAWDR